MMKHFELLGVELFVFGRIVGATIRTRPNSSKAVFGTALTITKYGCNRQNDGANI